MKRNDQPFVVGRRTGKSTTVVLIDRTGRSPGRPKQPIRGPWTLRAVVTPSPAR